MGSQVTQREVGVLHQLREAGVIEEVQGDAMRLEAGMVVVSCADGDQMEDEFEHLRRLFHRTSPIARIHLLALNGGALLLSSDWPDPEDGRVLFKHIGAAEKLKDIHTIALFAHIPCGAAGLLNLSAAQVIDRLISAKRLLKEKNVSRRVICLLHVDWSRCDQDSHTGKRTYHVKRAVWEAVRHEYL